MYNQERKCAYCGHKDPEGTPPEENSVSTHSGVWECRRCWYWRKLDGPAASYWWKKLDTIFEHLDMWDCTHFLPGAFGGDKDKMTDWIESTIRVREFAQASLEANAMTPRWPTSAEIDPELRDHLQGGK